MSKNTKVLLGSVKDYTCKPMNRCSSCEGSGRCSTCKGKGDKRCTHCSGSGKCHDCHGTGAHKCTDCNGRGLCKNCNGKGQTTCLYCGGRGETSHTDSHGKKVAHRCQHCNGRGHNLCSSCHGTGKCKSCGGKGENRCKRCGGSGRCEQCNGNGRVVCHKCGGAGKCIECNGSGQVVCKRCNGSGWYQQYLTLTTTRYSRNWAHISKSLLANYLWECAGDTFFDEVVVKWLNANDIEFDNRQEAYNQVSTILTDKPELLQELSLIYTNEELQKEDKPLISSDDKLYDHRIKHEIIPITTVEYQINNINYKLIIAGSGTTKHIIYDSIPTKILAPRQGFFRRVTYPFRRSKIIKSSTIFAAYMCSLIGSPISSNRLLQAIIKHQKMRDKRRTKFLSQLSLYDEFMSLEELTKKCRPMFRNPKTLALAWQCVAIDNLLCDDAEKVFSSICLSLNISTEEQAGAKRNAAKLSKLKDDELMEYYF